MASSYTFENTRYNRQRAVPLFGDSGQQKLSESSVVVVGAGGVKSPVLYYLAAAGIGRITIVDADRVEHSNLNRQILYQESDIGRYKAEAAAERLRALNSDIQIVSIVDHLTASNFETLLGGNDLAFEGGSSDTERGAFCQNAHRHNLPYIHASAHFNYSYVLSVRPGETACFNCVYFDPPRNRMGPVPVIGTACGIAGSMAASEAIIYLLNRRFNCENRVWFHDGWSGETMFFPTQRMDACIVCGTQ
jgi:adenylyltransferase/sulfurtransferase